MIITTNGGAKWSLQKKKKTMLESRICTRLHKLGVYVGYKNTARLAPGPPSMIHNVRPRQRSVQGPGQWKAGVSPRPRSVQGRVPSKAEVNERPGSVQGRVPSKAEVIQRPGSAQGRGQSKAGISPKPGSAQGQGSRTILWEIKVVNLDIKIWFTFFLKKNFFFTQHEESRWTNSEISNIMKVLFE